MCQNSQQRTELICLADTKLEKRNITITKLKKILIDLGKLGNDNVASEMIKQINHVDQTKNDKKKPSKHRNVKCFSALKWVILNLIVGNGGNLYLKMKNREKGEEKDGG